MCGGGGSGSPTGFQGSASNQQQQGQPQQGQQGPSVQFPQPPQPSAQWQPQSWQQQTWQPPQAMNPFQYQSPYQSYGFKAHEYTPPNLNGTPVAAPAAPAETPYQMSPEARSAYNLALDAAFQPRNFAPPPQRNFTPPSPSFFGPLGGDAQPSYRPNPENISFFQNYMQPAVHGGPSESFNDTFIPNRSGPNGFWGGGAQSYGGPVANPGPSNPQMLAALNSIAAGLPMMRADGGFVDDDIENALRLADRTRRS